MRWPWTWHRVEAREALESACERLEVAEAKTAEVTELVTALTEEGQRNHFIERLNLHVRRAP